MRRLLFHILWAYLMHRKCLASKGKKKLVSTAPSSPSFMSPVSSVALVGSSPSLPSVSVLFSFFFTAR